MTGHQLKCYPQSWQDVDNSNQWEGVQWHRHDSCHPIPS